MDSNDDYDSAYFFTTAPNNDAARLRLLSQDGQSVGQHDGAGKKHPLASQEQGPKVGRTDQRG